MKSISEVYELNLTEICGNCGCTYGSHCASTFHSSSLKMDIPKDYCPGHEDCMDWDKGPGTTFISTGKYKDDQYFENFKNERE